MNITAQFELSMAPLQKTFLEMPWDDKHVYGAWLAQTFYYVSHSTRLLALSAAHCNHQEQGVYHSRFVEHLREEKGHEKLAIRDLEKLGLGITDFPELPELSAFYQTQYYWIQHQSPLSFLGYILCLEGLAVRGGQEVFNTVANMYGKEAASFLKVHATEDVGHLQTAIDYTKKLQNRELALVIENMKLSCSLYKAMLTEICSQKSVKSLGRAA